MSRGQILIWGWSCRTTFSSELWTSIPPLYLMKPSLRNLFMKKLTRDRVVPLISASVSWLILAMTGSGLLFLAEVGQKQEQPGKPFFTRIEQLIDEVRFSPDRPAQKMADKHLGEGRLLVKHAHDSGSCPAAQWWSLSSRRPSIFAAPDQRGILRRRIHSAPRIATTASLPCSEMTVTFTLPLWT